MEYMRIKKLLPFVGIIIFVFILTTLDFEKIIDIFSKINLFYAFLSFFVLVPLLLIVNVEWQLLLKHQKINVSFWYSIKNFFIGYFYGFITPGGFGAYTRALYLSDKSGSPLPKCFSNIVIYNTVELLAMLSVGLIGAIFLSSVYPYLFLIIIIVFFLVILLYLVFFKSKHSRFLFKKIVESRVFSSLQDRLKGSVDSFQEDIPGFKDVIIPFTLSITGWILKYTTLFFIASLFQINIPFYYFILIMAVADVIASIPVSIYGIGTREAALITMFSVPEFTNGAIISPEQIVSLSLFWFVIIWLTPSIIGGFVTIYETRKFYSFKYDKKNCEKFEKYMKNYRYLYRNLTEIVKKYVKSIKKPVIVDLGVGPGLLSKEIKNIIPNSKIIGIDPSKCMLNIACKNADIEPKVGSSENIPLENDSVDLIVSRFSLTYWKNPNKSFKEIFRVLKPNGKFVIEALNKDFPSYNLFFVKLSMIIKNSSLNVARYHIDAYNTAYSIDSVIKLFKKNNFKVLFKDYKRKDWKFVIVGKKVK